MLRTHDEASFLCIIALFHVAEQEETTKGNSCAGDIIKSVSVQEDRGSKTQTFLSRKKFFRIVMSFKLVSREVSLHQQLSLIP